MRDNIKRAITGRIRSLLAKTVDNGCTEAEALAAAVKAKELMDTYQIDLSEEELEADGFVRGWAEQPQARKFNVQWELCNAVADYCEVKTWGQNLGWGQKRRVVFFGLRSDVELANWLVKALESFVWQKADEFGGDYYEKRSFAMGCVERIESRLREEASRRRAPVMASTGKSLVVVKQQLVDREYAKLGLKLRGCCSSYTSGGSAEARQAGYAAGAKATFGRPFSSGRAGGRITQQ
jgi:hypothetical protein